MPSPLSVKVTPLGSAPVSERAAAGKPLVVTVKVPALPVEKVAELPLVMPGSLVHRQGEGLVGAQPTPLSAVMMIGYVPPLPLVGVPPRVAVPSPLSVRVTPPGSVPLSEIAAVGFPADVTVKVPALPTVKVVESPLVMVEGPSTTRSKSCAASG